MNKKFLGIFFTLVMIFLLLGSMYLFYQKTEQIGAEAFEKYSKNLEEIEQEKIQNYSDWLNSLEASNFNGYEAFNLEHNIFEKVVSDNEGATIVFLGDSTTEQNEYTNGQPGHVKLIEDEMKKAFNSKVKVFNAGVSGNDLTDMNNRISASVLRLNPDIVFINSSLNDVSNGVTVADFKANYQTMIDRIHADTDAKIILRTSNFTNSPEINVQLEESYNGAIKEVAKDNNLGYIDLYTYYKEKVGSHADGIDHYNFNHFHPNEVGQELIRDSVLYALVTGNTFSLK